MSGRWEVEGGSWPSWLECLCAVKSSANPIQTRANCCHPLQQNNTHPSRDVLHEAFQNAHLAGDALDAVDTILIDTPGPVPSDHRALSAYALLRQVHGFVGFTHHKLPASAGGLTRLGWVRAPAPRAAVRAAVLGRVAGGSGGSSEAA